MDSSHSDHKRTMAPDVIRSIHSGSEPWKGLIKELPELADALATLRSQLRQSVRSIVVEDHFIDKDYRSAFSGFYSRKFVVPYSRSTRMHFFSVKVTRKDFDLRGTFPGQGMAEALVARAGPSPHPARGRAISTPGYIGCVSARATAPSGLGRTLLDPRHLRSGTTEAHALLATFRVHVRGQELCVQAFPSQSQDRQVHTCAETSLWCLFRYLSQRYPHYPEIYPYELARLNHDLSSGRSMPSHGLTMEQMASIMGDFGLDAEMYKARQDLMPVVPPSAENPFVCSSNSIEDATSQLLHVYTESGMPPIIGVPEHAMVVVGCRQSRSRSWVKREGRRVVPATDFVDCLLVNDDNHPPYRDLGVSEPQRRSGSLSGGHDRVSDFIVPFPKDVTMRAEHAEEAASQTLHSLRRKYQRVFSLRPKFSVQRPLVRRLVCTSAKNYREWAVHAGQHDPVARALAGFPLPRFLWVATYFEYDDWTAHADRRLACYEIALDATAHIADGSTVFLWGRCGGQLVPNEGRLLGHLERLKQEPESYLEAATPPFGGKFPPFSGNMKSFQSPTE